MRQREKRTESKPVRVVLGVYSSDDGEAAQAFEALSAKFPKARLFRGPEIRSDTRTRTPDRYASVRLEGESLIVAETVPSKVPGIVQLLQSLGSPAVFVVSEGLSDLFVSDETLSTTATTPGSEPIHDFARKCAESRGRLTPGKPVVLSHLRESEVILDTSRRDLAEAARLEHALTAAAEWLLDNGYLIRTQIAEIRRHLPRDHHKILPSGPSGEPFVYELAKELAAHSDHSLNESNIRECLAAYQEVAPLTIAELWSFPLMLRMALIAGLSHLALQASQKQQLREAAYFWANRLAVGARRGPDVFQRMLRQMAAEPVAMEPYFLTCLAEQLQDEEDALAPLQHWIEDRLKTPLTEIVRREHTREAAEAISTANAFGSLRAISRIDFSEVFESTSLMEVELTKDPSGTYAHSDFATRDRCRRVVERISRNSGVGELDVARRAVALAAKGTDPQSRQVAFYLLDDGVRILEAETHARLSFRTLLVRGLRRHATGVYIAANAGLTLCFTLLALALAWDAGIRQESMLAVLGLLALFPLSELALQTINVLVISLLPPATLPKLDFDSGIPAEQATLVVIPMMLSSADVLRRELEKLEVRFLANQESSLFFSLFSDFLDAATETAPGDAELLEVAREGVAKLNERYPSQRFLLFHRKRVWSESEQRWIGRERKRGKIEELNAFLAGDGGPSEILQAGSLPLPVRYVITLDADTQLPPGAARRMVETIAHPLNQVVIDPVTKVRRRGFTVIQPRVSIALPGATATRFTRIFADTTGTDPYCQTVSDAQQDLFGEAIFHGKAIYDLHAFRTILGDRFPAETLLSHDLIEGAHAGVGLASEIELFENLPLDYAGFSQRQHRWIRGDWQIAPWIFDHVPTPAGITAPNPLSMIGRWRILDNLRRSLVPVASLLLLLFGWLISRAPGVWTLVIGLAVAIPAVAPLLDRLARHLQGAVHGWRGAADEVIRAAVMLVFLPHQAWLAMDAIARVFYRRKISHQNLLEWTPAESSGGRSQRSLLLRQMWIVSGLSVVLMLLLAGRGVLAPTAIFVALWAASPMVLRWLDRSAPPRERRKLPAEDSLFLHSLARKTWRFFDDLVGEETHWLPPDNTQLSLHVEVAQRTSPTNIGLWLTSALAAHDLGYLTTDELLRRSANTVETIGLLERYEGHLLNWYDTRTLEPLLPRYVSTVDSGNLLASLWVIEQGFHDAVRAPVIGPGCFRGLADTVAILNGACGSDPSVSGPLRALRRLLHGKVKGDLIGRLRLAINPMQQLQDIGRWPDATGEDRSYWVSCLARELTSWTESVDRYLPWMETLTHLPDSFLRELGEDAVKLRHRALHAAPSLLTLASGNATAVDRLLARPRTPGIRPEVGQWLDRVAEEYRFARDNATQTVKNIEALVNTAKQLSASMNMGFLYDKHRRLFGIGYLVGSPLEFSSHYDLLASECRLASMVAIAKGDVPMEHWFALGRPHVSSSDGQILLSWTGTMFEYLMPLLFMRTFANSLLDQACHEAVRKQVEYGKANKVPWGVSESAYSALDANQVYQYRAFGIPALALKQELAEDVVVAPYATMLALGIDSAEATENLKLLEEFGLAGPMGLYESIDFTVQSKRGGDRGVVIYAYMAHHQGMTLVSLDNLLHRGVMQRRFHADLRVRAVESLLFERIPVVKIPLEEPSRTVPAIRQATTEEPAERAWKEDTYLPRVHLQGNVHYSLMVTNAGGGYSRWNAFDVTRWRSDTTLDPWGSFLYIRDMRSDTVWAAAYQPVGGAQGTSSARFSADRAEFHRRLSGIETVLDVTVAAEDDVELRRFTVMNRSIRSRHLEFTSYAELALTAHGGDKAHPAFAKMFIETEYTESGVLIAHRRLRSPDEPPIWAAHILVGATGEIQFETDREKFLGRGNTPEQAAALRRDLSGSVGTVLDPIFSLRCRAVVEPRDRLEISFLTVMASSREALLPLINKYRRPESVTRAFEMAWTRAQLEFRYLGVGPAAAHRFQDLASHLLYPNPRLRVPADRLARNRLGQVALWGDGISGDLPILTITVTEPRSVPLVRELLLAHAYWRLRGLRVDLVILNQEIPSYDRPLHLQLLRQVEAHSPAETINKPGGVFLRDWHGLTEEHRNLILAVSSVVLSGSRGPLQQQLATVRETLMPPAFAPAGAQEEPSPPLPFLELPYFNGLGGFTPDGHDYAIYLKPGSQTPTPWVNVMAGPHFGALVSESGLGFTWFGNSQANRLTPWHNDPVTDPQSEIIYLRDEESGTVWTPTPRPIREEDAYRARHAQGSTLFEHNSHAIGQELTVFVPLFPDGSGDPVKVYRLRLRNHSDRKRRLTVTYFAEWVLGSDREDQQLHVQTSYDESSGALLASQAWTGNFTSYVGFIASSPRATSYSGDRTQFLGRNGSKSKPAALGRIRLDNRVGAGLDPGGALQVPVSIDPGNHVEVVFLLGQGENIDAVRSLVSRYDSVPKVEDALTRTHRFWDSTLNALQVRTPLLSTDFLLNRWLPYQALSCRFWGRSALYQSGGAWGFRDQLQDSMALVYSAPQIAREHILVSAARQFVEGDVQHWWHAETGMGVRTRCSDDMLWLPFVVANYVRVTGDAAILDEEIPFLDAPVLAAGEQEKLSVPPVSSHTAPLWEHCRLAIDYGSRLGAHGLPLFGSGDWNDGMNLVGIEGRGESSWLAWFLCAVLDAFCEISTGRTEARTFIGKWRAEARSLVTAMDDTSWDGEWYLRGFFDDGSPLGSHANQEARIDSLPQSWSVIAQPSVTERARQAMASSERFLVDEGDHLVKLFTPPFDCSTPNPGYIMGYPPGLRENGGQYTHGSLWMAMARARMSEGNAAVHLLKLMNPAELTRIPEDVARYRGEPYVVAADIYAAPGKMGRSGWTWYTGSAGWMYRIWIEEVLGFHLRGEVLTLNPVIPDDWPGFDVTYRHRSSTYEIKVSRNTSPGPKSIELNGEMVDAVRLVDDGKVHRVSVRISSDQQPGDPIQTVKAQMAVSSNGSVASSVTTPKAARTS